MILHKAYLLIDQLLYETAPTRTRPFPKHPESQAAEGGLDGGSGRQLGVSYHPQSPSASVKLPAASSWAHPGSHLPPTKPSPHQCQASAKDKPWRPSPAAPASEPREGQVGYLLSQGGVPWSEEAVKKRATTQTSAADGPLLEQEDRTVRHRNAETRRWHAGKLPKQERSSGCNGVVPTAFPISSFSGWSRAWGPCLSSSMWSEN